MKDFFAVGPVFLVGELAPYPGYPDTGDSFQPCLCRFLLALSDVDRRIRIRPEVLDDIALRRIAGEIGFLP